MSRIPCSHGQHELRWSSQLHLVTGFPRPRASCIAATPTPEAPYFLDHQPDSGGSRFCPAYRMNEHILPLLHPALQEERLVSCIPSQLSSSWKKPTHPSSNSPAIPQPRPIRPPSAYAAAYSLARRYTLHKHPAYPVSGLP